MAKNSIFRRLSDRLNKSYTKALSLGGRMLHRRSYAKLLALHPAKPLQSEKYYLQLWSHLSPNPDKSTYRLFSQYIGEDSRIVPEEICAGIVQPLLNPIEYRPYYSDKNLFDKVLSPNMLPTTILRGINGGGYNAGYQVINFNSIDFGKLSATRLFLKPTVDSSSGEGVKAFARDEEGRYFSLDNREVLDGAFLNEYIKSNPDFILQEGLTQHESVSKFNPTSINTIRVATYRSVIDNKSHFLNAIIRIGKNGAFVDNAHAGGVFVGVDRNGKVGKFACDQYGNRYTDFNGVDFAKHEHYIEHFDKIIEFSEKVASELTHARLVAQDICLEANGNPKLVEFNVRAFSTWLFQFTVGPAFAEYTDEIIWYCSQNKNKVRKVFVEPF